jgi:hypothetical protein
MAFFVTFESCRAHWLFVEADKALAGTTGLGQRLFDGNRQRNVDRAACS